MTEEETLREKSEAIIKHQNIIIDPKSEITSEQESLMALKILGKDIQDKGCLVRGARNVLRIKDAAFGRKRV